MYDPKTISAELRLHGKKYLKYVLYILVGLFIIWVISWAANPRAVTNTPQSPVSIDGDVKEIVVASIEPPEGKTITPDKTAPIRITFSDPVVATAIRVDVTPSIALKVQGFPGNPNLISIAPDRTDWESNVTYQLTIYNVVSPENDAKMKDILRYSYTNVPLPTKMIVY